MSKAVRVWKLSPLRAAREPANAQGTQTISKRYTVALISRNALLRKLLAGLPCGAKYEFNMFTTVHGHNLAFHDMILLDNGLSPFTVESYITRSHANKSRLQLNAAKAEARSRNQYQQLNFLHLMASCQTLDHSPTLPNSTMNLTFLHTQK